ncbi:MAG: TolC family protein [Phycisphaerales bacterium]
MLSLDEAIRLAIRTRPSLRRAGYQVDAAAGHVVQAGLYPNPSFVFDGEGLGSAAGAGGETAYRVEQEIVLGGKLHKARKVAEADLLAAQADVVAEEFAVASRVTRAYVAAVAAEERLESRRALLELADEVLWAARAQVEVGVATEPDRLRAEVVREQAQAEFESAGRQRDAALRGLAAEIGLEGTLNVPLTSRLQDLPSLPGRETMLAAALEANGRIIKARLAVERARRAHALAEAEAMPSLVASFGPRVSDVEHETTIDVGLTLEVPLFDRKQGMIRAALADRMSSAEALREVQLQLLAAVTEAYAAYESARIAADAFGERLIPKAERTLELTRQAYERGKADYLRVLDAQQVVVASRLAYIDALVRLHEAAALLRELAQTDAPWRNAAADDSNGENKQ